MIIQKEPFPDKGERAKKRRRETLPAVLAKIGYFCFLSQISAPLPSQGGLKKISTV